MQLVPMTATLPARSEIRPKRSSFQALRRGIADPKSLVARRDQTSQPVSFRLFRTPEKKRESGEEKLAKALSKALKKFLSDETTSRLARCCANRRSTESRRRGCCKRFVVLIQAHTRAETHLNDWPDCEIDRDEMPKRFKNALATGR